MISNKMGITLADTLGTVKPWASFIQNFAYLNKQILPDDKVDENADTKIKGGFVSEPKKGKHNWVMLVDISSAYPRLSMMGFNMSPETYLSPRELPEDIRELNIRYFNDEDEEKRLNLYLKEKDIFNKYTQLLKKYHYSAGVNGAIFTQEKLGIIPQLVKMIYDDRKQQKNKMLEYKQKAANTTGKEKEHFLYLSQQYNTAQMVSKVLINSLYGALGNRYFKLFNIHIARAITSNTRFFIRLLNHNLQKSLEKYAQAEYIVYNDTDSGYLTLNAIVQKYQEKYPNKTKNDIVDFLDNFGKKILSKIIQDTIDEFADILNAYNKDVIEADREVIADVGIFLNKKKYVLRVLDNEGVRYKEPDIKAMGVEIARSSTPPFFKNKLKESLDIIFDYDAAQLKKWLNDVRKEVTKQPLPDIAKTSSIGSLDYDLDKAEFKDGRKVAIPINSRGALAVNRWIQQNNLSTRYTEINTGDKVKLLYLKQPNPLGQDIMAFIDPGVAEEFRDYVDYDKNFEKYFMAALEILIDPLGWKSQLHHSTSDLDEW